jgi:hypothetical protein
LVEKPGQREKRQKKNFEIFGAMKKKFVEDESPLIFRRVVEGGQDVG